MSQKRVERLRDDTFFRFTSTYGGTRHQEVVVLKPGGPGSKAALGSTKKGHGRNWAVEGAVGQLWLLCEIRKVNPGVVSL